MIKYDGYAITFTEVPDEVSICINITNCQGNCKGCHSPHLREDIGENLEADLPKILEDNKENATCVCFMGEGNDPYALGKCILMAKLAGYKTCLYSGRNDVAIAYQYSLDYIKYGEYIEEKGGLNQETTNQRFSQIKHFPVDMTYRFRRRPY
ncbi:MAG: anaerobic ribonucleoside-triphosphate reductase activating protein [Clostridia bacterium]|nr:anaerobic ribonucleoside-triphosphate reductase activating protein [Clostridia bacterium]